MKILIAYDGSRSADAALDDLKAAGLPAASTAHILSVAEVWLPPPPEGISLSEYAVKLQTEPQPFTAYKELGEAVSTAEDQAKAAEQRLKTNFPDWNITSEATYGSPAWEILERADHLAADLIVVGAQGLNLVERIVLGSISQKVLTEAHCSVRIARGRIEVEPASPRIVLAFDGSKGAEAATNAIVARDWPEGTEVRMVSVTDVLQPSLVGHLIPPVSDWVTEANEGQAEWLRDLAEPAIRQLSDAGLVVEHQIGVGTPKEVIIDEAERWHATSIFLGANRFGSRVERFLLGSVSSAVAARAHCSVEVIRNAVT